MTPSRPNNAARAARIMHRLDELARISSEASGITRLAYTPEHAAANALVAQWMTEAGMAVRTDEAGNLIGRIEGSAPDQPAVALGSHLDTVRNAGRYDGPLGVVLAIEVVAALAGRDQPLPVALEVIAFADEEGVRFKVGLLGSHVLTGSWDPLWRELEDDQGVTLAAAMREFGLDPSTVRNAVRDPQELAGYLEVHIEQGPALETEGVPVGVVTAVAGALRQRVTLKGRAGHAGTVPMNARRDALAAASECVLALEELCGAEPRSVGTVGELTVPNGTVNVIPGEVRFSVDIRSADDSVLKGLSARYTEAVERIGARRGVAVQIEPIYSAGACAFDGRFAEALTQAVQARDLPLVQLPSGAGHDAMLMAGFTDTAMLFVRCKDGVSHDPAESVEAADVQEALAVAMDAVARYAQSLGVD